MYQTVIRVPKHHLHPKFHTCNLCYNRINCCRGYHVASISHVVIVVCSEFEDWEGLEAQILEIRSQGQFIRLITEKDIPNSILYAIAYDHRNILQINVDTQHSVDQLVWTTNLAHAAERCGLFFVFMIYPIIPGIIQTHQVLAILDTIRSMPYCIIMLKFAVFYEVINTDSEYITVDDKSISRSYLSEIKPGLWGCTEEFKNSFMQKIFNYSRFQQMDVGICEDVI